MYLGSDTLSAVARSREGGRGAVCVSIEVLFCSVLFWRALYLVVMYDDEDGHYDGRLRLRLSAIAAYWTGLDWTGMPRRFEEYVLDDPTQRERGRR